MADPSFRRPLPAKRLRWRCEPSRFPAAKERGRRAPDDDARAGGRARGAAPRAHALRAPATTSSSPGSPGSGRRASSRGLLDEMTAHCALPADRAYVNDFKHPERPRLLELPRGQGAAFVRAMERARSPTSRRAIRRLGDDEAYAKRREEVAMRFARGGAQARGRVREAVRRPGFAPGTTQAGSVTEPDVFYVVGEQAVSMGDLDAAIRTGQVAPADEARIRATHVGLRAEITAMLAQDAHARARAPARTSTRSSEDGRATASSTRSAAELAASVPLPRRRRRTSSEARGALRRPVPVYARGAARGGGGGGRPTRRVPPARPRRSSASSASTCSSTPDASTCVPGRGRGAADLDEPVRPDRARRGRERAASAATSS